MDKMDSEATDQFLKQLNNKQRNLTKKLKRITDKASQKKDELTAEEAELIKSKGQVETALAENARIIENYQKCSAMPKQPKRLEKEDSKATLIDLLLVGAFLSNPEGLNRF